MFSEKYERDSSRLTARAAIVGVLLLLGGCEPGTSQAPAAEAAVATDPTTGLQWLRCAIGQASQGGRCTGQAEAMDLMAAQERVRQLNTASHAGIDRWRLPTIAELSALRRCDHGLAIESFTLELGPGQEPVAVPRWCAAETTPPTIDTALFPDTPPIKFWSGSGSEAQQHFYAVDFGTAWIGLNEPAEARHAVRPVADQSR